MAQAVHLFGNMLHIQIINRVPDNVILFGKLWNISFR